MLLISPIRAAAAIGSKCTSPDGSGETQLLEMLRLITPHAEEALNVKSLTRGEYTDTYELPATTTSVAKPFRLSNGFIVPGSVVLNGVYDDSGNAVTTPRRVDYELGMVWLPTAYYGDDGDIQITYLSGFEIPADAGPSDDVHQDPNYRTLSGVPDLLAGAVVAWLTDWRRNMLATPAAPSEYGFLPTLNAAVIRTVKAYLYSAYLRPRDGCHWAITSVRNG